MSGPMEGDSRTSLPLPPPPPSIMRQRAAVVSPLSCRSCRGRKSKCSREIPICETCHRHGFQCVYDATPKKRISHSHLVKDLLRRMDTLEKRCVDPESHPSQDQAPDFISTGVSLGSHEPISPVSQPILDIGTRREILNTFFSNIHGNPYIFLDEETTRSQVLNDQVSDAFLHSLTAVTARHVPGADVVGKRHRAEYYLRLSEQCVKSWDLSLESIHITIMQAMCLMALGQGVGAWMKIGAAIRMAQGIDLQKQAADEQEESADRRNLARHCVFTLYAMDRFCVCGSNRPMLIGDEWLRDVRLPTFKNDCGDFGAPLKFGEVLSQRTDQSQAQLINGMFTGIVKLLGKSTHYLQKGGVQGDSHFPWHQHSNLSKLVEELGRWRDRVESVVSFQSLDCSNETDVNRFYLSWFLYHAIMVRVYRQFLPLIMAHRTSDDEASDPWQQETARKCVDHAVTMSKLCDQAQSHGYSWPFFTSFCLASAATVLIHARYYDFATGSVPHLVTIVERLVAMQGRNPLVEHQCEMLRRMYKRHVGMIKEYCSGTLVTTNIHLTQFYKRYPEGEFDPSHIPFSQPGDWKESSLDGPDDLFALGSLPEKLGHLRGSPYTFEGCHESVLQFPTTQGVSYPEDTWVGSPGLSLRSDMFSISDALDGYFEPDGSLYTSATATESHVSQDYGLMDQELLKSVLEHMEGDCSGIEF